MQCQIVAIGHKMPQWCLLGCEEYLTRLKRFMKCSLIEIPTATSHKEGTKMLQKISPSDHFIALDVAGQSWSSLKLSEQLSHWQQQGKNIIFGIGGPDGLSEPCLARANQRWSLSALTFPHAMVRVILLEQLYRAASILANHPYHRE